jgi:hypothetical protein
MLKAIQVRLACIVHKSQAICDQRRLWQQPRKAFGAAALWREEFKKTACTGSFILKQALKQTHSVSLRAF